MRITDTFAFYPSPIPPLPPNYPITYYLITYYLITQLLIAQLPPLQ